MKQNKLFLGLATMFAAAFTFTACSSDDAESQTTQESGNIINFTYGPAMTRTATDPQSGTSVSAGLNVGIFGVSSEASTTMTNDTNTKYLTASGNALSYAGTEGNEMTWPTAGSATASIYAYAPYQEGWIVDAENTFTVGADQSDDTKYLASDLLYASATDQANGSTVPLAFGHKLAKVNVTITKADGSTTNLAGAKIYITGTKRVAKFTPSTGVVAVDGTVSASDILALTIGSDLTAGNPDSKATACAVVVPQDLVAETAFIKIVTSNSKTLIGKLGSAATLASNGTYSMNISVGNVTATETVVKVSFGSTSLLAWDNETPIGLSAYGIGDYVLTDGTFMKKSDYASASVENKAKVAGIIFSLDVSSTDRSNGYVAYAVGKTIMTNRIWNSATGTYASTVVGGSVDASSAINDLDGLTKSKNLYDNYMNSMTLPSGKALTDFVACFTNYGITLTGTNLSAWFLPSFGQMAKIFNGLSGTSITEITGTSTTYNGTPSATGEDGIISKLNSAFSIIGGENQIPTGDSFTEDINFATSSEYLDGSTPKTWLFQFNKSGSSLKFQVGSRNGNGKYVMPCVAIKAITIQ